MEGTSEPQKRRGVIRKKLPPSALKPQEETVKDEPLDLDSLFNQMHEVLEETGGNVKTSDMSTLDDQEGALSSLIRQNSEYGTEWSPNHITSCSCKDCTITRITVTRYNQTKHLCVTLREKKICDDPSNVNLHSGFSVKDENGFFLCEKTAMVHLCGEMCRASKYLTTHANEYVCPISGQVLGVEMKGDWWTDPDKQEKLNLDEPEMDSDAWAMNHPRTVTHKVYDQHGNQIETTEYAPGNIVISHHPNCHNNPIEKRYYFYLMRCKNILWLILYSAKRQQVERQRLLANYDTMTKSLEKYVRICEKNKALKGWHEIRGLVRFHMKSRTDTPIWIPPLRIMEPLLFHYARIIVKFFWVVLEKTPFGRTCHTQLSFDYFVIATITIMRTRGLIVNECQILPYDQYFATHIDPGLLHHFGIQVNFVTKTRNSINRAIKDIDPKLLVVTVTSQDAALFQETRERRMREFSEKQKEEMNDRSDFSPDPQTPNKRRKKM